MVYPTVIAAVSDATEPRERARAVGVYRFWRDFGFVLGALVAGVAADVASAETAILIVTALTAASGLAVLGPLADTPEPATHGSGRGSRHQRGGRPAARADPKPTTVSAHSVQSPSTSRLERRAPSTSAPSLTLRASMQPP
jgi:MFS family permease